VTTAPRALVALCAAALCAAAPARAGDPHGAASVAPTRPAEDPTAVLLAVLPVDSPPGLAVDGPLRARLELTEPGLLKVGTLRGWFPAAAVDGAAVTVELAGRAPVASPLAPTPRQRGPSFFVDYDQPAVGPFRAAVAALAAPVSDDALASLVDGWIVKKNMTRGLDPASRVAKRREGDCSEHAVLLAAAARLAGRPSRIVLGVALLPLEGRLRGFGHAWVEIHDGTSWRTADATPLPKGVRYVPLAVLSDEGPGYLGAAWAGLSPLDVRRVVLAAGE
jgi:hypothetical protein